MKEYKSSQNIDKSLSLFPRWNAMSKLVSKKDGRHTSAIMIAGNSQLENEIDVARGFPKLKLEQDEIIILQDVMDVLGLKEGDRLTVQYDLFQSAVSDLNLIKMILFNFPAYQKQYSQHRLSQGEAILKVLKVD